MPARRLGCRACADPARASAPEAINQIVENVVQCKFEATNPVSDEVVLFNILQVGAAPAWCCCCASACALQSGIGALIEQPSCPAPLLAGSARGDQVRRRRAPE